MVERKRPKETRIALRRTRIGAELAQLRAQRGQIQEVFAQLLGVSKSTVDKLERGIRMPTAPMIATICDGLTIPDAQRDRLLLIANDDRIRASLSRPELIPVDPAILQSYREEQFSPNTHIRIMLSRFRNIRSLTMEELASSTRVSLSLMDKIEGGRKVPSAVVIANIGRALGIPDGDPLLDNLLLQADYERIQISRMPKVEKKKPQPETPAPERQPLRTMLSRLRRQYGLSHDELIARTGISRSAIEKAEDGSRIPSAFVISKITTALEIADHDPILDTLLLTADHERIARQNPGTEIIPVDAPTIQRYRDTSFPEGTHIRYILSFLRNVCGISQDELARRINSSRSMIEGIEHGTFLPSAVTLINICRSLGISDTEPIVNNLLLNANYIRIAEGRAREGRV